MFLFVFKYVIASYNFDDFYDDYYDNYLYDYRDFNDYYPFVYEYPEYPQIAGNYVESAKEVVQERVQPTVAEIKESLLPVIPEVKSKTISPAITVPSKNELKKMVEKRPVTDTENKAKETKSSGKQNKKRSAKKSTVKKPKKEEKLEKGKFDNKKYQLDHELLKYIFISIAVIIILVGGGYLLAMYIRHRVMGKTEMEYYRSLTRPRIEPDNEASQRRYAIRYG
ncbi:hypothetical protein THOM_3264 [Trachipleistophora hominis]|uniref:Uncharacterized protein n=1 Tax=Trachipleistophora hominis TaxID=72359 RepID=L7JQW1_TRAHO|nr:hypothetical protein THOM_3264 [Trachipleistophora hominis]